MNIKADKRVHESLNTAQKANIVLVDIEGTTTSITFVKDTLFPYARQKLESHVRSNWDSAEFLEVLTLLREQAKRDVEDGVEGAVPIPDGDGTADDVIKNVLWQMDLDRKTKALKQLQGHIWRDGYKNGDLKGHVYQDVVAALRTWVKDGRQVYVYSSGSVEAQKLLFGHLEEGSVLEIFSGHFDTEVGAKVEASSYLNIANKLCCSPNNIVFFTDSVREAEAAKCAGLNPVLVVRGGNAPLSDEDRVKFPVITSFQDYVFEVSAKKQKLCVDSEPVDTGKSDNRVQESMLCESNMDVDMACVNDSATPCDEDYKMETTVGLEEVSSKKSEESRSVECPCSIMTDNSVSSSETIENSLETICPLADVPSCRLNDKTSKMCNAAHNSEETMAETPKVSNSESLENKLCSKNKVQPAMENEAGPAMKNEARPAVDKEKFDVENEVKSMTESGNIVVAEESETRHTAESKKMAVAEKKEARPAAGSEKIAVAEEKEARPAAENEKVAEAENEAKPAAESEKMAIAEENKARPAAENEKMAIAEENKARPAAESEKMAIAEENKARPAAESEKMAVAEENEAKPAAESEKVAVAEENKARPAAENEKMAIVEENEARPAAESEKMAIAEENEARPAAESEKMAIAEENKARPAAENEKMAIAEKNKARPAAESEKMAIAEENKARPAAESEKVAVTEENKARPAAENEKMAIGEENEARPAAESEKMAIAEENKARPAAESEKMAIAEENKARPAAESEKMAVAEEKEARPAAENEKVAVAEENKARPAAENEKMAIGEENEARPAAESEKMAIAEENKARPAAESEKMAVAEEKEARRAAENEKMAIAEKNEDRPTAENEKVADTEEDKARPAAENEKMAVAEKSEARPAAESEKMAIAEENKARPAAENEKMAIGEENEARPAAESEKMAIAEENKARPAAENEKMAVAEENEARPAAENEKMAIAEKNEDRPAAENEKVADTEENKARPAAESEKMAVAEEKEARPAAENEKMAIAEKNEDRPAAENEKVADTEENKARPAAESEKMAVAEKSEARPAAENEKVADTEEDKARPAAESEMMDIAENEVGVVSKREPAVESEKMPVADESTVAEDDAFLGSKKNDDGNHKVETGTYNTTQTVNEVKDCVDRSEKTENLALPGPAENNKHGSEICRKHKTDIFKSSVVNQPIDINAETAIADRERGSETGSILSCGMETCKVALASPGQPVGLEVTEREDRGKPGVGNVPENIEVPSSKAEKEFVSLVSTETSQSKLSPTTEDESGTRMEIEMEGVGECVSEPFVDVAENSKIQEASGNLVEMGVVPATGDSVTIPEMSRESGVPHPDSKPVSSVDEPEEKLSLKPERNNEVTVENFKAPNVTGEEEMEVDIDDGTKISAVTDGEGNVAAPLTVESEAGGKSTPQMEIGSDHTRDTMHSSARTALTNCARDSFVEEMDVDVSFEAKSNDVSVAAPPEERVEFSMETGGDISVERLSEHTSKEIVNDLQLDVLHNTGSVEKKDSKEHCKVPTEMGANTDDEKKIECLEPDGLCNQIMEPETSITKQTQSLTNEVLARSEGESVDVPVCGLVKNVGKNGEFAAEISVHKSSKTEELQAERNARELVSTEEEPECAKDLQTGNTGASSMVGACAKVLSEGLTNKSAAENASEMMQPKDVPVVCGENSANSVRADPPVEGVPNNVQPDAIAMDVSDSVQLCIAPQSLAGGGKVAQSNRKTDESSSATGSHAKDNASEVPPVENTEDKTNSKTDNGISTESKTDSSSEPGENGSVTTGDENFKDCKEKLAIVEQNGSICVQQSDETESIKVKRLPVDSSHALNKEETNVAAHS